MTARLDNDDNVVMSVDIVGSTSLYESVGDAKAQELVGDSLVVIKDICAEHGAVVVGEAGDEVVCVVSDATEAASAASEIHAALFEQYGKEEKTPVRVRIGLHFGPAPASADALMSETTKIAKWAQGNAKPEQTLATRAVIDQLPRIFRAVSRYVDDETWNFVSLEHVELHEVVWDVESITAFNGEAPRPDSQDYKSVEFTYGDACVVVDVGHPVISIGRGAQNDLVVPNDLVSRQHLRAPIQSWAVHYHGQQHERYGDHRRRRRSLRDQTRILSPDGLRHRRPRAPTRAATRLRDYIPL